MTLTHPATWTEEPTPEGDEERWRLTFAGAKALGYKITWDGAGEITCYNPDLNLWVRMCR